MSGDSAQCVIGEISIHALRVEGDVKHRLQLFNLFYFYPRPPGGGRQSELTAREIRQDISIHALRVEGDAEKRLCAAFGLRISIHALRVEGDSKNGQNFRLFLRKREKNLPL